MEYRIKMIQKYSGENLFIPQYRKDGWLTSIGLRIFFSPFIFLVWLFSQEEKKFADICEYFSIWDSIEHDKNTFKEVSTFFHGNKIDSICDNKANAEQVIKIHKQNIEDKLRKEQEEKNKIEMERIKKVLYINIK